jgi:hemoglobin
MSDQDEITVYEAVGGKEFFVRLTAAFYRGVAADPPLRALYPDEELGPAELRLRLFLEQYWGGPTTYSDERGHPRLRMRHAPYLINLDMRDRWLRNMETALNEQQLPQQLHDILWRYFTMAAISMVNAEEGDPVEQAFREQLETDGR